MNQNVLPNIDPELFSDPTAGQASAAELSNDKPRVLLLFGSLRERSFSQPVIVVEVTDRMSEGVGSLETRPSANHVRGQ